MTVKVVDAKGAEATQKLTVRVVICKTIAIADPPCPIVIVSTSNETTYRGERVGFDVTLSGGYFVNRPDYRWAVTNGRILKGQHTPHLEVEATGDVGTNITAEVEVDGLDVACSPAGSNKVAIK